MNACQVFSKTMDKKEDSYLPLESTKMEDGSKKSLTSDISVTQTLEQMSIEDSNYIQRNQQCDSDFQSTSMSDEQNAISATTFTSIMDQACDSENSRREVRQKAIQMMKHSGYRVSAVEPGEFAVKYALSAPYHLFFTRIEKSKETYNQQFSITFPEILDRSLGEIVDSLHLNCLVDSKWLCLQYLLAGQSTDMIIFYANRIDEGELHSNVTMIYVDMPNEYGCHHSKIMILQYKDGGIRVIVSTANLYNDDWENRTQGLWISPRLPLLPESAHFKDGESPTGFKKDFERYINKYKHTALRKWISAVRKADFSAVNVFFIGSVPGVHKNVEFNFWGHKKLAYILSRHVTLPPDALQWPIVAQTSSIGSFGPNYGHWLSKEIISCMLRETGTTANDLKNHPNFQFIFPSVENYKNSFDYQNLCCGLFYTTEMHSKQEWIQSYLYQWKAVRTGRDRAMPHIKSYTRISPDFKRIPWFVLTSANLSKAAWGVQRYGHYITSYEGGVIFIPKFIIGTATFPIQDGDDSVPVFPIPYDLPLSQYKPSDKPFVIDVLHNLE